MVEIPERLGQVAQSHPDGPAWIERLPGLVGECCERWQLRLGETFPASFSYVARVEREAGSPAVLKLTLPGGGTAGEAEALRRWHGDGAVLLLDDDPERSALLLELVEPGEPLASLPVEEALAVALDIAQRLWLELERDHPFPTLAEANAEIAPLSEEDFAARPDVVTRAELDAATDVMLHWPPGNHLLHGDLHSANIRSSSRGGWVALDPGATAGDRAADLGWMLLDAPRAGNEPVEKAALERTLALLADETGVEASSIRSWAVARATVVGLWTATIGANTTSAHMLACVAALRL
jgi:streptomycin 6-kinase